MKRGSAMVLGFRKNSAAAHLGDDGIALGGFDSAIV